MKALLIGDKASLSAMRRCVRADLKAIGLDPSASFDCLVAVTEACVCALGNGGPDRQAEVSWEIDGHDACFFVHDLSGQELAMASHPSRSPEWADSPQPSRGRDAGIAIMKDRVDEVAVERSQAGTRVTLVKHLD